MTHSSRSDDVNSAEFRRDSGALAKVSRSGSGRKQDVFTRIQGIMALPICPGTSHAFNGFVNLAGLPRRIVRSMFEPLTLVLFGSVLAIFPTLIAFRPLRKEADPYYV